MQLFLPNFFFHLQNNPMLHITSDLKKKKNEKIKGPTLFFNKKKKKTLCSTLNWLVVTNVFGVKEINPQDSRSVTFVANGLSCVFCSIIELNSRRYYLEIILVNLRWVRKLVFFCFLFGSIFKNKSKHFRFRHLSY